MIQASYNYLKDETKKPPINLFSSFCHFDYIAEKKIASFNLEMKMKMSSILYQNIN